MTDDRSQLAMAARLFGRLLVRELDAATLDELAQPDVQGALGEVGIELPPHDDLDELAHQWLSNLLHPQGMPPPVQSLVSGGGYDGDAAVAVRNIAKAAAKELAPGARNAPVDHIGCILLLWADLIDERSELAERLAADHMAWAEGALARLAASSEHDFYPSVARAAVDLIAQIRDQASSTDHSDSSPSSPPTTEPK